MRCHNIYVMEYHLKLSSNAPYYMHYIASMASGGIPWIGGPSLCIPALFYSLARCWDPEKSTGAQICLNIDMPKTH